MGTQHRSHCVRSLQPSLRTVRVAEGRSRGGAVHRCEGRLTSGAPSPPAARPLGGLSGPTTHVLWARVCGCGSPALFPWLACPAGAACRAGGGGLSPGGAAFHCCGGRACGVRRCPSSAARALGWAAGAPRPVCPGCGWCGRGYPATSPTACAPASRRGALRGWWKGVPRGGALRRFEGRLRPGAPPSPGCPPSGRAVRVRYPCAFGAAVRMWEPSTVPLAGMPCGGCVPRGWWGAISGGGWPSTVVQGVRLVSGTVPPLAARALGRAARVPRPVCPGCVWCGRAYPAPAPQRAPLRAVVARCGCGGRASPGAVPCAVVRGV